MSIRGRLGVLLLVFVCWPFSAYSQTSAPQTGQGGWDFSAWAAIETGEETSNSFSQAQIVTTGIFVGKILTGEIGSGWRRGRLEFGAGLTPLFRQFQPQPVYGFGFEPVILRWNSAVRRGRVSPYVELGGGGLRTNINFPAGDTSDFNFTARAGAGIMIWNGHSRAIDIGCRWSHISNANLGDQNPNFNGILVNVGYHWFH